MSKVINLRSDTVTQPSSQMRDFMVRAKVGDDAYHEDKSVNLLEDYCKELFGVEAALFSTSGMLSNRLALLCQTAPGDEVVTDYHYHINFFDSAATASICHVVLNTRQTERGILTVEDVEDALHSKPRYYYFSQIKAVTIENTINGWVGKIFPFEEIKRLRIYTQEKNMALHLDGARLFHAHVETEIPLSQYAEQVDTLSVCFSKGLGAPFGSILLGKKGVIDEARKHRLWLGSGVHQAGFQAAAAYYALKHHIPFLKEDHEKTKSFKSSLEKIEELMLHPDSASTNMIQWRLQYLNLSAQEFIAACEKEGLLLFHWLPGVIRAVIHRDISERDLLKATRIIQKVIQKNRAHLKEATMKNHRDGP